MGNVNVKGYPDVWGKHKVSIVDHTGPVSLPAGGEVLGPSSTYGGVNPFGTSSYDFVLASTSISGNYTAVFQPSGTGQRTTGNLIWQFTGASGANGVASVTIATPGSGQTNGTYTANASSGTAQIQYTIAGGALTTVKVLNPGGPYATPPTFTIAAGGTAGTVTATLGSIEGMPVGPGTNLSGETIRLLVIGK